jgi:tripartite ATP-independent transporter DctM subunit
MGGIILLIIFFFLIAIRMPVSIAMGIATLIAMIFSDFSSSIYCIPMYMAEGTQSYGLLAVPFFILTGNIMNRSGLTDRIFDFANHLVGHLRGGLAQVNVVASMIFAGISGAAVADAAGLGVVEIKAMTDRGYKRSFSAAITLASSIIGPIIPPSIGLVIIGVVSNTSIGRLFLAGVIPGILVGISLMVLNVVFSYTRSDSFPLPQQKATFKEIKKSFGAGLFALFAPVVIIGGMTGGFVTATEAGILAANYALLAAFIYNKPIVVIQFIPRALLDTAKTTALIMFIIALATSMTWFLAILQIPSMIVNAFLTLAGNKYILLLLLNVFLLIVGAIIEGIPALLIIVPILLPVVDNFGIDRVHFGMIVHLNLLIGLATPPMGIGLYIMTGVAKVRFEDLVREFWVFYIPLLIVLLLITYVPQITLFLPNLLMGK